MTLTLSTAIFGIILSGLFGYYLVLGIILMAYGMAVGRAGE